MRKDLIREIRYVRFFRSRFRIEVEHIKNSFPSYVAYYIFQTSNFYYKIAIDFTDIDLCIIYADFILLFLPSRKCSHVQIDLGLTKINEGKIHNLLSIRHRDNWKLHPPTQRSYRRVEDVTTPIVFSVGLDYFFDTFPETKQRHFFESARCLHFNA